MSAEREAARIDWSQYWFPGPTRSFSAAEMARAGRQAWPRVADHYVLGNLIVMLAVGYQHLPRQQAPLICAGLLLLTLLGLRLARWLWWHPTRKALNLLTLGAGTLFALLTLAGVRTLGRDWMDLPVMLMAAWFFAVASGWWFLVIFRVQQIESRLREIDERGRSEAMQAQLLQAQIQPHFLFNSLASLQHWVEDRDQRAAPLLRSLTGYLRATLPLFNRQQLTLGEELAAVREYLAVMQARLGGRLRVEIELQPGLERQPLPPALLLTLVENAIEHGVLPRLGEACVRIEARRLPEGMCRLTVSDDGPGLVPTAASAASAAPGRGLGLRNSRQRLAQAFGPAASLSLADRSDGTGCVATLMLPTELPE